MTAFAYVGGYTIKDRNGRGEGINVYRVDAGSGAWSHLQLLGDIANPSWLLLDRPGRVLYAAHGEGVEASAYAIDPASGRLRALGGQPTGGTNGVRLGIDASDRFLVCANYNTGTVATLPIEPDGSLGALRDLVPLEGTPGPASHPADQRAPARRGLRSARPLLPGARQGPRRGLRVPGRSGQRQARPGPAALGGHPAPGRDRATPGSTRPRPMPTCSTSSTRRSPPTASIPRAAGSSRSRSSPRCRPHSPATTPRRRSRSLRPADSSTRRTAATTAS